MLKKIVFALLLMPILSFAQDELIEKDPQVMVWDHVSREGTALLKHFWQDRSTGDADHASTYIDSHFQSSYYFGALNKSVIGHG